ncbi:hypothetical protein K8R43_00185 [archaeon]|nr:hypothetical protein [archaeon]
MKADWALKESFEVYKQNFWTMVAGMAIVGVLTMLSSLLFVIPGAITLFSLIVNPEITFLLIGLLATTIGFMLYMLFSSVLGGGYIGFCADIYKNKKAEIKRIFSPKRILSLAIYPFILGIPFIIVSGIIFLLIFFLLPLFSGSILAIILILLSLFFFWMAVLTLLYIFLSFTLYAIVLEDTGVIDGARNSIKFVRQNIAEVIVFFLLIFGISTISSLVTLPFMVIPIIGEIIMNLLSLLINMIMVPWLILSMVIFYLSLTEKRTERRT